MNIPDCPRTDAEAEECHNMPPHGFESRDGLRFVRAQFARTLERELAVAIKDRDEWKCVSDRQEQLGGEVASERDALRAEVERLKDSGAC